MAKNKESKIGLIIVMIVLVLLIIVVGVFLLMYLFKMVNYQTAQPYCPELVCVDGSTPFSNMAWYDQPI